MLDFCSSVKKTKKNKKENKPEKFNSTLPVGVAEADCQLQ